MMLTDLGFDDGFRAVASQRPEYSVARVTAVDRDRYLVRNERGELQAELSGKLLYSSDSGADLPCVGDWVFVLYYNADRFAIVHDLFPRKSVLSRKRAGRDIDVQLIASNIDVALIMQSCDRDFNVRRLERYLVMANEGNIEPLILLSKADLVHPEVLDHQLAAIRQAKIGARVIAFSSLSGLGLDAVIRVLEPGKTYCVLGSSGVGKTTLLNHLIGRDLFDTGPVREKDGKGRHVTARRQLLRLESGALLIDTPGMREVGLLGVESGIAESFSDILDLMKHCRFRDCTHSQEPGCSIRSAIQSGVLSEERYRSYVKLAKESAFHEMSYVERRRKDRAFGRMAKEILKHKRKD